MKILLVLIILMFVPKKYYAIGWRYISEMFGFIGLLILGTMGLIYLLSFNP